MTNTGKLKGEIMLMTAALIWGSAFIFQKTAMDFMGPLEFTAYRFSLGTLAMIPVVIAADRRRFSRAKAGASLNKKVLKILAIGGALIGIVNFTASEFQQIGIVYTTAGKAGFVTAMDIVIVPLLMVVMHRKVHPLTWAGVLIAVGGMYLLCVHGTFFIQKGDLLCLCGAFGFAVQILLIDHFVQKADPLKLALFEFAVTSVLAAFAAILFEKLDPAAFAAGIVPILYTALLEVCAAFTLQMVGQKATPPAIATIIMSLESVFAVLSGMVFLGERMSGFEIAGCVIMFTAFIIAQIPEMKTEKKMQ